MRSGLNSGAVDVSGVPAGGTGAATLPANRLLRGNGTAPVSASVIRDNGARVGVGADPTATEIFSVTGNSRLTGNLIVSGNSNVQTLTALRASNSAPPTVNFSRARGTNLAPTAVVDGDVIGEIQFGAWDGGGLPVRASIDAVVEGAVSVGTVPTGFRFSTGADGAPSPRMSIAPTGEIKFETVTSYAERATRPDPVAGRAIVFAEDNGAGKTRLMVQFGSGDPQQLAIEP